MIGEHKGSKGIFKSVGRGVVYLPAFYDNGNVIPADVPFLLSEKGDIKYIKPENIVQDITLIRKFSPSKRMEEFANHMIGGKFQGANKADFSDAVTLFTITDFPESYFKKYPVDGIFRYVRYVFPLFKENKAEGNIAEIGFMGIDDSNSEVRLEGKQIGCKEIKDSHYEILFDNKLDNYVTLSIADTIIEDYPSRTIPIKSDNTSIIWVGLDLGKKVKIKKIGFCPRNDTNNLYEHCKYELFHWNEGWISLGEKSVSQNNLVYENVPVGALFLLHNQTEGTEERIFTYENGKQVWW